VTQPQENSLETILVVEDHPIVLQAVTEILERAGFCVLATGSGEQAIQVENTTEQTIHLLLSDVMMPDMSGPAIAPNSEETSAGHARDANVWLFAWRYVVFEPRLALHRKTVPVAPVVARVNEVLHTPERSQGDDHFDNRIKSGGHSYVMRIRLIFERSAPVQIVPGSIAWFPQSCLGFRHGLIL
jgi:hypothetical protein